jgi:hypothetical protein
MRCTRNEHQPMNRKAECCCGQLCIEMAGEPNIYGVCHCNNCKKRTGSAFGISAYFKKDNIVGLLGSSDKYAFLSDEQNHDQERHFCNVCGTTLFWYVSTMPEMIGIAGGCFVADPLGEPKFSTNHHNICSWLSISESLGNNA